MENDPTGPADDTAALCALVARLREENAALKAENQALAAELLASRASLVRLVRTAATTKVLSARADTINAPSDKRLRARLAGAAGKLKDALDDADTGAAAPPRFENEEEP